MSAVLVRTEMGLQLHVGPAALAADREHVGVGRMVCAWCGTDLGPAQGLTAGEVSRGMCQHCTGDFCSALPSPTSQPKPAEDRGAQPAAAQGAHLGGSISVRPHPTGGWTLAYPRGGSALEYRGWYRTESQALAACWRANGGAR
jgi:hypothetical protein